MTARLTYSVVALGVQYQNIHSQSKKFSKQVQVKCNYSDFSLSSCL